VTDITIRPTAKFIKAGAVVAAVIFLGLEIAYFVYWSDQPRALLAVPPLVFLWPVVRAIRRNFTRTTIAGDRLRYELGTVAKSTRNIQLSKIQDVRVDQRLMQRVFGVGNLSIETAGESSRLTLFNVDDPQKLADEILGRAQHGTATGG
jgi:uncharacterized membrane protein YdbT with pleckstrin-like domain